MKMTAFEKIVLKDLKIGTKSEQVTNPYSKVVVTLTPEAVALYDLIRGTEFFLSKGPNEDLTIIFYNACDVFRKNWPKEYMLLLD